MHLGFRELCAGSKSVKFCPIQCTNISAQLLPQKIVALTHTLIVEKDLQDKNQQTVRLQFNFAMEHSYNRTFEGTGSPTQSDSTPKLFTNINGASLDSMHERRQQLRFEKAKQTEQRC